MGLLLILLSLISLAVVVALLTSLICFLRVFYAPRKACKEEYPIPEGEIYEEYREQMTEWIREMRKREHRSVEITSFDGLTLRGKYYGYL